MKTTAQLISEAEADAEQERKAAASEADQTSAPAGGEAASAPPPSVAARGLVAGIERLFKFKDRRLAWTDDERKEGEEVLQPVIEKRGLTGPLAWLPEVTAVFWIIAALVAKVGELRKLRATDEKSELGAAESQHVIPGAERRREVASPEAESGDTAPGR